jgi:hypothetical protein
MTLRWISLVPAAIVAETLLTSVCAMRPCSGAQASPW